MLSGSPRSTHPSNGRHEQEAEVAAAQALTVCLASAPINDVLLSTSVDILRSRFEVPISATRKIMNAPVPAREWRIGYAEGPDTAGRHVRLIVH